MTLPPSATPCSFLCPRCAGPGRQVRPPRDRPGPPYGSGPQGVAQGPVQAHRRLGLEEQLLQVAVDLVDETDEILVGLLVEVNDVAAVSHAVLLSLSEVRRSRTAGAPAPGPARSSLRLRQWVKHLAALLSPVRISSWALREALPTPPSSVIISL